MTETVTAYHKNGRRWKKHLRADKSDDPRIPHGTTSGYKWWKCSCPACKSTNKNPVGSICDPLKDWVWGEDVVRFIKRSEPDLSYNKMAKIIGCHESRIRRGRRAKIHLETADKWLTAFDLNYLLYTGDIEIHEGKPFRGEPTQRLESQNGEGQS